MGRCARGRANDKRSQRRRSGGKNNGRARGSASASTSDFPKRSQLSDRFECSDDVVQTDLRIAACRKIRRGTRRTIAKAVRAVDERSRCSRRGSGIRRRSGMERRFRFLVSIRNVLAQTFAELCRRSALSRPATRENASLDDARDFLRPASGHVREETEPGVYRWLERTEGPAAEIEIESLEPKPVTLHWLKDLRAT